MSLISTSYALSQVPVNQTYEQAQALKNQVVWKALDSITIEEAIYHWLDTFSSKHTKRCYQAGIKKIIEYGFLNPFISLQAFALVNHEAVIDQIKQLNVTNKGKFLSECTRQARAACYISLTAFLNRRLQGIVKKALPSKEKGVRTFFRVYEKVKTNAMNQAQWLQFLQALEQINPRDCLMAKIVLQGGKRINEVLTLQTYQIDWQKNEITFMQSKTKGYIKETVITYPESIMQSLKNYIGQRTGQVFITRFGKSIDLRQVAITFAKAGKQAHIPFKVTPHVLRASTVTYLKQQGFSDSDIMRVTGHASSSLVYAYDKNSRADNASKKVSLVY